MKRIFLSLAWIVAWAICLLPLTKCAFDQFTLPTDGPVNKRITREVKEKGLPEIILGSMANTFPWTELHVFFPYEGREEICPELGLNTIECWWKFPESVPEGHYLLVFRNGETIIHYEYQRDWLDVNIAPKEITVFTPTSRFEVERNDEGPYRLAFRP